MKRSLEELLRDFVEEVRAYSDSSLYDELEKSPNAEGLRKSPPQVRIEFALHVLNQLLHDAGEDTNPIDECYKFIQYNRVGGGIMKQSLVFSKVYMKEELPHADDLAAIAVDAVHRWLDTSDEYECVSVRRLETVRELENGVRFRLHLEGDWDADVEVETEYGDSSLEVAVARVFADVTL